jgi:CheY-like chemotaxis protein
LNTEVLLLLVEDEPLILLSAQDALEGGGYAVLGSESGTAAQEIIAARISEIAGLVTDIRVGSGPSGWELARQARELRPDLPVVYVTGDSAHEWPVLGVPKSLLIQKPYAGAQLLTAISSLLTDADACRQS